jgi:hypothetical protein
MTDTLETIISGAADAAPTNQPAAADPSPPPAPAPSESAPASQAAAPGAPPPGFVPHQAIAEARSESRALKEHLARLQAQYDALHGTIGKAFTPQQPAQQPPDWFENPDAALQSRLAPVQQSVAEVREQFSHMMAIEKHGQEAVQAAMQAIEQEVARNPAARFEVQRMMTSQHPYGELVAWHKQRSVLSEIGTDPAAYREKLKAEILAEIQQTGIIPQAPVPGQPAPKPVMPSNFADQRTAGARSGPAWAGPAPLQDIFDRANKPR